MGTQIVKKYSDTVLYQHITLAKFSGFCLFWFAVKTRLKFQVKRSIKMISTFPVSVKMCAKVIPTKGKHYLKPQSAYIRELKKEKKNRWRVTLR